MCRCSSSWLKATWQGSLIVLGAYGHGALERMFFGSTAQHVVREAVCPVLTLREGAG